MTLEELYEGEIDIQIQFAERAFGEFVRARDIGDVTGTYYHAHHFLVQSTNVAKLIDVESDHFRAQYLANLFNPHARPDMGEFRRLRNHLEHFDERLDVYAKNYRGQALFDMNLITGAQGFPRQDCLRAVVGQAAFRS